MWFLCTATGDTCYRDSTGAGNCASPGSGGGGGGGTSIGGGSSGGGTSLGGGGGGSGVVSVQPSLTGGPNTVTNVGGGGGSVNTVTVTSPALNNNPTTTSTSGTGSGLGGLGSSAIRNLGCINGLAVFPVIGFAVGNYLALFFREHNLMCSS
jgi:hypothetical protein